MTMLQNSPALLPSGIYGVTHRLDILATPMYVGQSEWYGEDLCVLLLTTHHH